MVMSAPVLGQDIPPAHTIIDYDLAVISTILKVFSFDQVCAKNRINNLSYAEQMHQVLRHSCGLNSQLQYSFLIY